MVAEPVSAAWGAANYYYDKTAVFVSNQADKLLQLDIGAFNPLGINHGEEVIVREDNIFQALGKHKGKITILSVGLGASIYYFLTRNAATRLGIKRDLKPNKPRRRVPKLLNGARNDVVLVVGSPTQPLTRLISLDFEKRGFIVYLTILDDNDLKYSESNPITEDINYLNLTDSFTFESQLAKFNKWLHSPVVPFPNAEAHTLKLAGVVFTPNLHFPIGPLENISIASWNKILDRFAIYLKLFSSGLIKLIRSQNAKTILITPSITSSLSLAYHGPESVFQNAIQSLFTTVTREISQHNLSVTQIKLGNISVLSHSNSSLRTSNLINSEINSWHGDIQSLYSENFIKSQRKLNPIKAGKGSNLRDLYHILFDLIYSQKKINSPVVYCGSGARIYDWLSCLLPASLINWILG